MRDPMKNDSRKPTPDEGCPNFVTLSISQHEYNDLWGSGKEFKTSFEAAQGIVRRLNSEGVYATIATGGVSFSVDADTLVIAERILAEFDINSKQIGKSTLKQQIGAHGLLNAAARDPFGPAGNVLKEVVGDSN